MLRKIALGIALASLCLTPALAFGIDFKAKGQWVVNMEYGQNGQFTGGGESTGFTSQSGGQDDFSASQRVRLQLDAVASQSLSGTVYFEIGSQKWGNANQGAALGADGTVVELKNAYIDFIPFPSVKTRMGIQNVTLPGYSVTSQIMSTDVAGIVATINVTDNMDITAMWLRPWNDNFTGYPSNRNANYRDNADFFGLTIPVNLDGVKLTAWGMYGLMGPNTFREGDNWTARVTNYYSANLFPLLYGNMKKGRLDDWGSVWWAGFTGEVTAFAPWRFAWDLATGRPPATRTPGTAAAGWPLPIWNTLSTGACLAFTAGTVPGTMTMFPTALSACRTLALMKAAATPLTISRSAAASPTPSAMRGSVTAWSEPGAWAAM